MVYVLNKEGNPLMPTERYGKIRRMLRDGQATVVRRCPFTIRLMYESTTHTQNITLGVDAGYKHIGLCASTEKKVLYQAEIEERIDIVNKLKTRREFRRGRRHRKCRHRKPRFNNRVHSKHKSWLAPSVEHKIDTHITVIKKVMNILPVTKVIIETAEFDIHKIKNPEIEGLEYQKGEKYGHINTRNYILWRDSHKCRCCGNTKKKLYVMNAEGKITAAPEDLYTVCRDCLQAHLKGIKSLAFKKKRHFAPPTQMGIMRDTLIKRATEQLSILVEQTYGYVTKGKREEYGIEKSHINDAYCIAGNLDAKSLDEYFFMKKVRCHNRQIHRCTTNKGGYRKNNQAPYLLNGYRLYDKIKYQGKIGFVTARRLWGNYQVRDIHWNSLSKSITYKKLKFISTREYYLCDRLFCT